MRRLRYAGRAVVSTTALLGVLIAALPALAGAGGAAWVTQSAGSGSWTTVATNASSAPYGTGALSLPFGAKGKQVIYFNVVNTGTLPLTGTTYTLSGTNLPGGSNITVYACVGGTWNQATNACSGTITQVVSSTGAASSISVSSTGLYAQAAGAVVQLVAFLSKAQSANSTGTLSLTLTRTTQVRAAQAINS